MIRRLCGRIRPFAKHSNGGGFTLIEIMVGALLLLVVMAGVVPFFLGGLSHASAARHKSVATNIAREKLEEIRQLDYREIVEDEGDPTNPMNLSMRFGESAYVPERNMTFFIDYDVDELADQRARSVQVTVSWTAPPAPMSPAVLKTVIAEQYLGPKMGWLEVWTTSKDNLDTKQTPFPVLRTDGLSTNIKCHLAESDWFLAYDSLTPPLPSPNDVFLEYLFRDDAGIAAQKYNVDSSGLVAVVTDGSLEEIYFQDSFDACDIPDGYWDLHATMYNAYHQPGNTWVLRFRVEKGPPEAPTDFTVTATSDTSVVLRWTPGAERDRLRYVLERREQDTEGAPLDTWIAVADLPPNTTYYTDTGALDSAGYPPYVDLPPCGRPDEPRIFEYRLYGVDTGGRSAPDDLNHAAWAPAVTLGGVTPTEKVLVPPVTGMLLADAQLALEAAKIDPADPDLPGLGWAVTEELNVSVDPSTVLAQDPAAGTEVEQAAIINLTVATNEASPDLTYSVTFTKSKNPAQTIYVHDDDKTQVYSVTIDKHTTNAVATLHNGHYNISLSPSGLNRFQSFYVSGANKTVNIP